MRSIAALVVFAVFLLPMVAVAPANAAISVEGPSPTPGDSWTYHTNTSLEAGLFLDGRLTLSVISRSPTTVEGTSYDAYEMSISGAGTASGDVGTQLGLASASGSWILTGREFREVRGLKVISRIVDLQANGTLHAPAPIAFVLRVQNTTTYRIQADPWLFPLQVGDSAQVSSQMNFTEDVVLFLGQPTTPFHSAGLVWWNVTHAVTDPVEVQTPAGQFTTYPIRETYPDRSYTTFSYAPAAGNHARTETHNETAEVSRSELVAYRYQAIEPTRFLGLSPIDGAIAIATASVAVAAAGLIWWRRRKRRVMPPETDARPPVS